MCNGCGIALEARLRALEVASELRGDEGLVQNGPVVGENELFSVCGKSSFPCALVTAVERGYEYLTVAMKPRARATARV